jgi:acyl-CoA synthetase (AMP-forming)/AMP-acid ligase II/thioesterase domain-containing protein
MASVLVSTFFEQHARKCANDIAVITPDSSVTYEELFNDVVQLSGLIAERTSFSHWLPVVVDRSIASVVAIFAALRSGRPFALIEGSLPRTQIHEIVLKMGSPSFAVVAKQNFLGLLPSGTGGLLLSDRSRSSSNIVPVESESPGLLFFTSGSTAQPKGVVLRWSAADQWLTPHQELHRHERVSVLRPLSLAAGFGQVTQIASGTALCMVDPRSMPLEDVVDFLSRSEITRANLGSGPTQALLRLNTPRSILPTVREFLLSGFSATWEDVPRVCQLCSPDVTVVHGYAATETGRVSAYRVDPGADLGVGPLPLASPGQFERLTLARMADETGDDFDQEILVRNPSSIEYWNNTALTSRKFFTDEDGVRWWRSGDTGRIDESGNLYLTGRIDDMIKINGMRVEPGAAEAMLRSIPGIGAAAVLAHPTTNGGHRLVGHVCVDENSLTPESVLARLSESLPSHLMPAILVRHENLPFNDRLKLDRQALSNAPLLRWTSKPATRSTNETTIWILGTLQQIIGLGTIGPDDDFWEAGLDSMGSVEFCSMVSSQKMGQLTPVDLLEFRTANLLEMHLSRKRPPTTSPSITLNPSGHQSPIYAIPGGGGSSIAFRPLAWALGPEQPLIVIEPEGMHCKGRIERFLSQRVHTVVSEVSSRNSPPDGLLIMGYSAGAVVAMESARSLANLGYRVHLVLLDGALVSDFDDQPSSTSDKPRTWKPRASTRIRNPRASVMRLRKAARYMVDALITLKLSWLPFRPNFTVSHYQYFGRMNRLAMRRHRLESLEVPTTLLHIANSQLLNSCRPWFTNLTLIEVGGDHFTMLQPPHVGDIAEHVVRIQRQLDP